MSLFAIISPRAASVSSAFKTPQQILLWIYRITLIGIFLAGGFLRLSLPSQPFMDLDVIEYLFPAIHWASDGSYIPTWRSFPYPLFLALTLRLIPHLSAIAWIQHVVGLFTASVIVLVLLRSRAFLPKGALLYWLTRIVALIAAYVFLFSPSSIQLEHTIRPEVFFALFSALTIWVGMEFSQRIFLKRRVDSLSSMWGILLILLSAGTYYVKPAWGFAVGTSLLPLFGACFWIPSQWKWKVKTVAIGLLLEICLFVLPSQILQKSYYSDGSGFLAPSILCTHAEFFRETMEQDALALPSDSNLRAHLFEFTKAIRAAQQHFSCNRYGLSLNPDDLMFRGPVNELYLGVTDCGLSFSNFAYHYYISAWKNHPMLLFLKIARQLEYFYSPFKFRIYDTTTNVPIKRYAQLSIQSLYPLRNLSSPILIDYENKLHSQLHLLDTLALPKALKWLPRLLNQTFVFILVLNILAAGLTFLKTEKYGELFSAALISLYYSSFNFANCLTIGTIHFMSVSRYHFNQISMSLISQGFAILFCVAFVAHCSKHWRSIVAARGEYSEDRIK